MSKKTSTKEKSVVVFEEQFPMISGDNSSVLDAMKNNLANEEITRREMFNVLPNPKGEAEWAIKLPTGKQFFESLEGIILHIGNQRMYYEQDYGEGGDALPPDCSSENGVIGIGKPGGKCIDCELGKFGPNSEPPKCSQKKPLYMLIPEVNPVMPVIINTTGPSFPNLKKFNIGLMQYGINTFDIKVRLTLNVTKTKNNRTSSVLEFEPIGNFRQDDPAGYEKLVIYRNNLLEFIDPDYQKPAA